MTTQATVNRNIRYLIRDCDTSQHALGEFLDLDQTGISKRLREPGKPGAIDWKTTELQMVAEFFDNMPVTLLFADEVEVREYRTKRLIDLRECAPWELNPQPADSDAAAVQLTFLPVAA